MGKSVQRNLFQVCAISAVALKKDTGSWSFAPL